MFITLLLVVVLGASSKQNDIIDLSFDPCACMIHDPGTAYHIIWVCFLITRNPARCISRTRYGTLLAASSLHTNAFSILWR